ncbi:MAG: isoamylase early set domain-containing protein [Acidobacteriota bacterium]
MIKKSYSKSGRACRVTFRLPQEEVTGEKVALLGDFNEWSPEEHTLVRRKNGTFSITLSVDAEQEYRFRYLVDESQWLDDPEADRAVPNRFGGTDGLLVV